MNKLKKPSLRFPEFSSEWEGKKLKELGKIYTGNTPSTFEKSYWANNKKGHVWITPTDINSVMVFDSKRYLSGRGWRRAKIIPENSVLITCIASIGKNTVNTIPVAINQQINAIVPRNSDGYFILSAMIKETARFTTLAGQTSTLIINKTLFENFVLLVPTFSEQTVIGNFMRLLDESIIAHERKFNHLQVRRRVLLQQMFPQCGEKNSFIRFTRFGGEWEEVRAKDVFTIARGKILATTTVSPVKTSKYKYPVYSSQTKNDGLMGYYSEWLFNTAITWTTDGVNAGTVKYRKGKFYCTNVCGVLVPKTCPANLVVVEALNRVIKKYVHVVGNPKLMVNVIRRVKFIIPKSLDEQATISNFIQLLDDEIGVEKKKINHLKLRKKALLQRVL